jgi:hypothetical protein
MGNISIAQLLDSIQAALSAAQGYSSHDAEREQQLQLAIANADDLQSQLAVARKTIADLYSKLNSTPAPTPAPAKPTPVIVIDFATRMAGLPIHVNVVQTPGVSHLSNILIDFGDQNSIHQEIGVRFNVLPGFIAAWQKTGWVGLDRVKRWFRIG